MTHVAVGGWVNRRNWESIETPVWRERGRREEGTRKEGDGGRFVFNPFGVECWNPDGTGGERQHEFWKNGGRTCVEKEGGILSGGGKGANCGSAWGGSVGRNLEVLLSWKTVSRVHTVPGSVDWCC